MLTFKRHHKNFSSTTEEDGTEWNFTDKVVYCKKSIHGMQLCVTDKMIIRVKKLINYRIEELTQLLETSDKKTKRKLGIEKRELMCEMFNDDDIQQQLDIKKSLDEKNLLNPGKVYPILRKCAEEGRVHVHKSKDKFPDLPRF